MNAPRLSALQIAPRGPTATPIAAKRMGITAACYGLRWRASSMDNSLGQFRHALDLLEHAHRLGAGGIQTGLGSWDTDFAAQLRRRLDDWGMFLEGQIALPREEADVERFERHLQAAMAAGADIVRTVCLNGRRYEDFDTPEAWRRFGERAWKSLTLAEPVVCRRRVRLAIENHKDWRVPELLELLGRLSSEWVGVCLDTGNNLALLEEPLEVVETLAPFAFTTHFKDMAVQAYEDGFLLSEVPLGEGFLDLKRMLDTLRRANPQLRINLEMITRDPLQIPVLGRQYWASAAELPARDLARTWALVRRHPPRRPLPRVSGLSREEHLKFEEANVRACFEFGRRELGF